MERARQGAEGREAASRQWLRPAGAQARRHVAARRVALGLALGLAAAFAAVAPAARAAGAFAAWGGPSRCAGGLPVAGAPVVPGRGEAVARRVSPYYSNADRERLARARKESRLARRLPEPSSAPINYDLLPPIEDIYKRRFTGNSTIDPIGGRKRYTYYVLFKYDPRSTGQEALKQAILEYIWFMKYKMSCRNIEVQTRKSPLDQASLTTLEYPMKEYGELGRNEKEKKKYDKATMVEFNFMAPVKANEYIQKKFYKDNNILRFMVLGHTRTFKHVGEDNELHL